MEWRALLIGLRGVLLDSLSDRMTGTYSPPPNSGFQFILCHVSENSRSETALNFLAKVSLLSCRSFPASCAARYAMH